MQISITIKEILKVIRKMRLQALFLQVCQEKELDKEDIDLLAAVISCESGWNQYAKNWNRDGSFDAGPIQANSWWYIYKMKLLTEDEAFNNPRKCFEVMIDRHKKGMLKDWVCFNTGLYLKHL